MSQKLGKISQLLRELTSAPITLTSLIKKCNCLWTFQTSPQEQKNEKKSFIHNIHPYIFPHNPEISLLNREIHFSTMSLREKFNTLRALDSFEALNQKEQLTCFSLLFKGGTPLYISAHTRFRGWQYFKLIIYLQSCMMCPCWGTFNKYETLWRNIWEFSDRCDLWAGTDVL